MWFAEGDKPAAHDTPIYDGGALRSGHCIQGPAIIEEADTTIVLQPGDRMTVTPHRIYDIAVGGLADG